MPKPATQRKTTEVIGQDNNDRRQRRQFTREDKLRIVAEAERSIEHGAIAALLRREGLYASHWPLGVSKCGHTAKPDLNRKPLVLRQAEAHKAERLERKLIMAHKLLERA